MHAMFEKFSNASRLAALGLLSVCILGMAALLHHPTLHGHGADMTQAMMRIQGLNAVVHGGMMILIVLLAMCLVTYATQRHWHRALPRSAAVVFLVGSGASLGAALVNGFIAPDFILATAHIADVDSNKKMLQSFMWIVNQRLMALSGYCIAASVLLWSIDLLVNTPKHRTLGLIGLVLAIAEVVWQWSNNSHFGVQETQLFWAWLMVWCLIVAALLWRVDDKSIQ